MRLLFVTQDFPPDTGGIQTYSAELAQHLNKKCTWFGVVAPAVGNTQTLDAKLPYPVYRVASTYNTFPLKSIPFLYRLSRQHRVDTAFHAQWQTLIASYAVRRFSGRPAHIYTAAHGRELLLNPGARFPVMGGAFARFRRLVLQRADGLFPVSRFTASLLKQNNVPAAKIRVVNNGTDPQQFYPQKTAGLRQQLGLNKQPVLLTVSRLVPRKGIDTVLRALPYIRQHIPELVYLVVGDGPDKKRLEALARELGVTSYVRFVGKITGPKLLQYYNVCDLFILAARNEPPSVEGFGIVFLEANACEKPVIGARSGGIPDAIVDNQTGCLVEPNNPKALAQSATELLQHPEKARRLGRQGRERVLSSASWQKVADQLYQALASQDL